MSEQHLTVLPPLIELPVLRSTYFGQEETDKALRYLWEKKPELVRKQAEQEPSNFDQAYIMQLAHIVDFLRNEASNEIDIPKTNLGMLDLLFELSRRLRRALDIKPWELRGCPLMDTPNDLAPDLPSLQIKTSNGGENYHGVTQEMVDRIISGAYKDAPELFYQTAECLRRGHIWPWDISNQMKPVIQANISPSDLKALRNEGLLIRTVQREIARRLVKYCEINDVLTQGEC